MLEFPVKARIVQFTTVRKSDHRICLLWPAWAYRVTAPVLQLRGLDLFERVVLGLCRAGVREPDRIAQLVNLHPRLCAHLLDSASDAGHLDLHRGLTELGRQVLRTGTASEPPEWHVRYVFRDPYTGTLWPRTTDRMADAYLRQAKDDQVELQLGSAGDPDHAWVARTPPPPVPAQLPSSAQVVAAASRDRADRRVHRVREYERREHLAPTPVPDELHAAGEPPELHRVAFIEEPEPVYLVAFVTTAVDQRDGWVAYDPFGVGESRMLADLVARFGRTGGQIEEEIARRLEQEVAGVATRYQQVRGELRQLIERKLVHEFGQEIRADRDALDLMLELDHHFTSAGLDRPEVAESGDVNEPLERVAEASLRLFEVWFRRLVAAYPPPEPQFRSFCRSLPLRRVIAAQAAQAVGLDAVPTMFTGVNEDELNRTLHDPSEGFIKAVATLSLLAAHHNPDHPLRRLAAHRPDLLTAVNVLNQLRNGSVHGKRHTGNPYNGPWCRDLAVEAVRELLRLPDPRRERTS
jgi:hypothetical protein